MTPCCLQSLQANVGHKAQQLQELEHVHKASRGTIAQLQQQVMPAGRRPARPGRLM